MSVDLNLHFRLLPQHERAPLPPLQVPPHLVPGQSLAVELHVPDPRAAARWLQRWGFEVLTSTRAFVTVVHGGQLLLLGRRPRTRPAATGGSIGELRVLAPDAAALWHVVGPDDEVVVELHRAAYGLVEFVLASPFGIDLRLATPAACYGEVSW